MDVSVHGPVPPGPFLSARDLLETEHDLELPVEVHVREDPDERTWNAHYDDRHVLNISRQAATSAMARGLALHEYAHMVRHEQSHPSHTQRTDEALFLALTGRSVERRKLVHCYQIANHMKDIYADDITLRVAPGDRLVAFLESQLADAVADGPGSAAAGGRPGAAGAPARPAPPTDADGERARPAGGGDPDITAVNAAFALALVERHDLAGDDHRIYDLAHAAARDAPAVPLEGFKRRFAELADDPDESDHRKALVDAIRAYADDGPQAAD